MNVKPSKQAASTTIRQVKNRTSNANLEVTKKTKAHPSPNLIFDSFQSPPALTHYASLHELPKDNSEVFYGDNQQSTLNIPNSPKKLFLNSQQFQISKPRDIKKVAATRLPLKNSDNKYKSTIHYFAPGNKTSFHQLKFEENEAEPFLKKIESKSSLQQPLDISIQAQIQLQDRNQLQNQDQKQLQSHKEINELRQQNEKLRDQVRDLKVKIQKFKCFAQENKRSLRQKISTFNRQGEELKGLRQSLQSTEHELATANEESQKWKGLAEGLRSNIQSLQSQKLHLHNEIGLMNERLCQEKHQKDLFERQIEQSRIQICQLSLKLSDEHIFRNSQMRDTSSTDEATETERDDTQIQPEMLQNEGKVREMVFRIKDQYETSLKSVELTYQRLIDQLKAQVCETEAENFKLYNEIEEKCYLNRYCQLETDLDEKYVRLIRQNSQLKMSIADHQVTVNELKEAIVALTLRKEEVQAILTVSTIKSRAPKECCLEMEVQKQSLQTKVRLAGEQLEQKDRIIRKLQEQDARKAELIKQSQKKKVIYQK